MRSRILPIAILLLGIGAMLRAQDLPVPKLISRVTDQAGVLTPDQRASLEQELKSYEDSTGNQFAVLIMRSINGESLEEYTLRVAEQNGIGTKNNDNGVLLLLAIDDRLIRFEVGYGLEGAIPDATTALIRENEISPRFRQGDYFGGLQNGLRALMLAGAGEYKAEPRDTGAEGFGIGGIILVVILIIVISRFSRGGGGGRRGGGGSSILPWIIASSISSGSRGGGWGGGSWGGGGSSGGGGGGWSGGGGSFGGGGSSGSW